MITCENHYTPFGLILYVGTATRMVGNHRSSIFNVSTNSHLQKSSSQCLKTNQKVSIKKNVNKAILARNFKWDIFGDFYMSFWIFLRPWWQPFYCLISWMVLHTKSFIDMKPLFLVPIEVKSCVTNGLAILIFLPKMESKIEKRKGSFFHDSVVT